MVRKVMVKVSLLLFMSLFFLTGCGGGGIDTDTDQEEEVVDTPADELALEFSVTAHNSNVLMVNANVVTEELTDVSIRFESAEGGVHETSTSSALNNHSITVVGLRPQTAYQFTAVLTRESGEITTSEPLAYTTPALPFAVPDMELVTTSDSSYQGITFFAISDSESHFIGVDESGVPVWYFYNSDASMLGGASAIKYLGDSRLMLMLSREVWVIDMAGNILSTYPLPNYHHEATILENGNIMVLTNEYEEFDGKMLKGDRIQEYSSAGALVWEWSSFEHLDTSRFPGVLSTRILDDGSYDWSHSNAIFQQDDGSILLSARNQSWVINIDHASGDINWILGSAEGNTNESLQNKFLSLTEGSWMSAQHAPMQTVNGDYLIYDNRNESELPGSTNNSRAVKYRVNTDSMSATQSWEYVINKYTQAMGDVDELPNGNILITAGGPGSNDNAHLIEVTANVPSQTLWELHINNETLYRSERVGWSDFLAIKSTAETALKLSGKITGLHLDGLSISDGVETLSLPAGTTTFEFSGNLSDGEQYAIQLISEPDNHSCIIENASGTISHNTANVMVSCNDHIVNADLTHLPIGDTLILQRIQGDMEPEVGKLWLCRLPEDGAGAAPSDDWTNADGSWNYIIKPQVEGENYYNSELSVTLDGQGNRIITGNALPTTPTGTFPVEQGTVAFEYDKNPNFISAHQVQITFDAIPSVSPEPSCVGFGATGISLTGSPIYQGSSTVGTDASAFEMLDSSGGHTDGTETYHHHFLGQNVLDLLDPDDGGHSHLMGYIQDGFGIFGPRGEDGKALSSAELDECHGHTHDIEWDGEIRNMYHYHWTYDFPYNVGCIKGTPQDLGINNS
ncbi:aryl-sulfate sulfotransferase [Aliikangiella sp. G2MR2-5]|uniref:aryl-sulfate sulfotransferase n=1 Tax=Aliikangiella sp. G2MR2-5 TaxID=2788943 RepID=UPI0018AB00A0|nr:aryl-sulfate sulfotransferase [Aliikangiella sp. G2MR2-5]